ncbi:hypothetical protein HY988_05855 [Candidatus Micrarchaeota archaeon]|nr:hypothetical protein [Candidatus Micrarchaeota archaeon]
MISFRRTRALIQAYRPIATEHVRSYFGLNHKPEPEVRIGMPREEDRLVMVADIKQRNPNQKIPLFLRIRTVNYLINLREFMLVYSGRAIFQTGNIYLSPFSVPWAEATEIRKLLVHEITHYFQIGTPLQRTDKTACSCAIEGLAELAEASVTDVQEIKPFQWRVLSKILMLIRKVMARVLRLPDYVGLGISKIVLKLPENMRQRIADLLDKHEKLFGLLRLSLHYIGYKFAKAVDDALGQNHPKTFELIANDPPATLKEVFCPSVYLSARIGNGKEREKV